MTAVPWNFQQLEFSAKAFRQINTIQIFIEKFKIRSGNTGASVFSVICLIYVFFVSVKKDNNIIVISSVLLMVSRDTNTILLQQASKENHSKTSFT